MQKEVFSKINYVAFITSGFGFMFKILLFSFLFFFCDSLSLVQISSSTAVFHCALYGSTQDIYVLI